MIELAQELPELSPRIVVMGVGGAGGNAVASMMSKQVRGVDFVVANTDAQALKASPAPRLIQLGSRATQGLGAGSRADLGRAAAEESIAEIEAALEGAHMCFIAAGMGGGTGTGAAPVIAKAAKAKGILTLGVVSKPFAFEGTQRARMAESGLLELAQHVDTLIVIPNQNLFRVANQHTTFKAAFEMADEVLQEGVRGITDLIVMPGLINLDFADIRSIMANRGKAMMGAGEASGDNRAIRATEQAISNPLLDDVLHGARGLIISISGGDDLKLTEVDEVASYVRDLVDPEADIIWGSAFNSALDGRIRVSVFATGIDVAEAKAEPEVARAMTSAPTAAAIVALRPAVAAPAPAQLDLRLNPTMRSPARDEAFHEEDELLLSTERPLVLVPPIGVDDFPTVDLFDSDAAAAVQPARGPSLFERIAMAARGPAWETAPAAEDAGAWPPRPAALVA